MPQRSCVPFSLSPASPVGFAFQHTRPIWSHPPHQASVPLGLCSASPSVLLALPHLFPGSSLMHQLALNLWLFRNALCRLVYELVRLGHAVVPFNSQILVA